MPVNRCYILIPIGYRLHKNVGDAIDQQIHIVMHQHIVFNRLADYKLTTKNFKNRKLSV